jgi:hypothetical protein
MINAEPVMGFRYRRNPPTPEKARTVNIANTPMIKKNGAGWSI